MRNSHSRTVLGAIFVIVGLLFLADNIVFFPFHIRHLIFSWPFLLVVVGVLMLTNSKDSYAGLIPILVGGSLLVFRYFGIPFSEIIHDYWPAILIIFGVYILVKPKPKQVPDGIDPSIFKEFKRSANSDRTSSDDYLDETNIFSGSERRIISQNFSGGKITSIFGATEIDLRDAKLSKGRNVLDITTIFGGTEITVPKDWKIIISVTSVFGGFDDERRKDSTPVEDETTTLEITGVAIFGGCDLKN